MDSTLAKGLAVIEWLARRQQPARMTDVAVAFGLARSNAHRTLQTLVECGWALQDRASSSYRPSLRIFELGALVGDATDIQATVRPHLEALAHATGETIHLVALDGPEIVYLDKFDSPLPVAAYSRIGGRAPAYCVASGKALLAAAMLDANALRALFGRLVAHTPSTITNFDDLNADLQRSRARGYAQNRDEWSVGVSGLGVPLFDARGEVVAAVGMSVPSIRFTRAQSRVFADQLLTCARDASAALGYRTDGAAKPHVAAPRATRAMSLVPPSR